MAMLFHLYWRQNHAKLIIFLRNANTNGKAIKERKGGAQHKIQGCSWLCKEDRNAYGGFQKYYVMAYRYFYCYFI